MLVALVCVAALCYECIIDYCSLSVWGIWILQGREMEAELGTDVRDGIGTVRVVNWCGCIVQDPHPAVRALGFLPEEGHGVYVAR